MVLRGAGIGEDICKGKLHFLREENRVSRELTDDKEKELARFEQACEETDEQLHVLAEGADGAIFEMQALLLMDERFVQGVRKTIVTDKVKAEYAVQLTGERLAKEFAALEDAYIQARSADILDVAGRLIDALCGKKSDVTSAVGDVPVILVAEDMLPSRVLELSKAQIAGVILRKGNALSHAAILLKGMGIPALFQVGDELTDTYEGTEVVVDCMEGMLFLAPDKELLNEVQKKQDIAAKRRQTLEAFREKKTMTKDGKHIGLYANAGSIEQVKEARDNGAEGIGLFRSEQLFLERDSAPEEEEQFRVYRQILELMEGKDVVIRTLDIGADKQVNYLELPKEENPALGLRGIRLCLEKPQLLKKQLRALYRASVFGKLHIMYPMITSVEEMIRLREIEKEVKKELSARGIPFSNKVPVGIMIETPAAALISDELAELVDFFSVGTNDLTQYTLATDRQNGEIADYVNPYHRAILKLLQMTVENGHKAGIPVSICGELAADRTMTETLVQLGFDKLSVPAGEVLRIRKKISTLHLFEE